AAESSDPVHAGEQADAGGTETQIILAYDRYHAGERPAKSIVDYSDDHRPAQSRVAPDEDEPLDHPLEHAGSGRRGCGVAMAYSHRNYRRDEIPGDAYCERATDADGREQDAANRGTEH